MKIIAIDDELGALEVLRKAIESSGIEAEVVCFSNALEADEYAKIEKCDVAFLDIEMPQIKGIELAKRIQSYNPRTNIIFTTGYSEFAVDAINLRASGYLLKPIIKSEVKKELENLRFKVDEETPKAFFKTFGSFDLLIDSKPYGFKKSKSKEALAYIIDREGSSVSRKELAAAIFDDLEYSRSKQSYITQIMESLMENLKELGMEDIMVIARNSYSIDKDKILCDSYEYQKKNQKYIDTFHGEYMSQYAWAKDKKERFK